MQSMMSTMRLSTPATTQIISQSPVWGDTTEADAVMGLEPQRHPYSQELLPAYTVLQGIKVTTVHLTILATILIVCKCTLCEVRDSLTHLKV